MSYRLFCTLLRILLLACLAAPAHAFRAGPAPDVLPIVAAAELPPEARATLARIHRGGPFPYPRDGIVFGNFERRLPARSRGYYHEYTVATPGRHDRGARRIIAGKADEAYYTEDHYRSFRRIVR